MKIQKGFTPLIFLSVLVLFSICSTLMAKQPVYCYVCGKPKAICDTASAGTFIPMDHRFLSNVVGFTKKASTENVIGFTKKASTHIVNDTHTHIAQLSNPIPHHHHPAHSHYSDQPAHTHTNRNIAFDSGTGSAIPVIGCKFAPKCEFSNGVIVRVKTQEICKISEQYPVEYEVTATSDVKDVVLTARLSDNSTYVSSQPEAKVSRNELTWNLGNMTKGQSLSGKVFLKSVKEGDICTCFTVKTISEACCSTMCAKAALACDNTGPDEVCVGQKFNYVVAVANTGTYPAKDVILTVTDNDNVNNPQTYTLGTIENGKSKKVSIPVTAAKRGKINYSAVATSSNADRISTDLSTLVVNYSMECTKDGPRNAGIGQRAPYTISLTNTGDRDFHDIVVTEIPHSATKIAAAEGATISDNRAIWRIPTLKAGETSNLKVYLTTRTTGIYTNSTQVASREGFNTTRETTTDWRGRAALDMNMSTSDNSIFTGETTRYKITVTNQGQETDSNVTITAIFPEGLEPVHASGDSQATINGHSVNFAPKNLDHGQTLTQYVTVKATKRGDLRPKVQVSSDSIKPPITQEESLIVN